MEEVQKKQYQVKISTELEHVIVLVEEEVAGFRKKDLVKLR